MAPTFQDLGLSPSLLRAVDALGFEEPTPIQARTIPLLIEGRDVLAQAQTGTGKTAAFAIPMLERIQVARRHVQVLIVVPTRELAVQVAESVHSLAGDRGVHVLPVYGGQSYDRQLRGLRSGAHVVVGTPGRIMDHIRRGTLDLKGTRTVVLDEADEMLDMGFVEDIEFILDQVPEDRQIALFSATVPRRIELLAKRYLRDPERVTIAQEAVTAPLTRQFYVETPLRGKVDALTRVLDLESPQSAIIFCRTKREVDELASTLQAHGYTTAAVHGGINQAQRERLLRAFRDQQADLLVATDVAARGLDIPEVTHVINFDVPDDADAYVHRIGRTGRMGRKGEAITFVSPREVRQLRFIEKRIGMKLKLLRLPSPADIAARRRDQFRVSLREAIAAGTDEPFALLVDEMTEEFGPMEIAAAAVRLAFEATNNRRSIALVQDAAGTEEGMLRLYLDAGRRQGLRPADIVGAFTAKADIPGTAIGTIDLFDDYALVDVQPAAAREVLRTVVDLSLRGVDIHVTAAKPSARARVK